MANRGEYTINNLYLGGYSSLSPNYGYSVSAGDLGITTDPRSANVLKEVSSKLSGGSKKVELALVSPEIFDSIPKQYLKEAHRLGKLTGVEMSVHGPVMDSAGMSQRGFSEVDREMAERRMADVLKRSYEVNPDGNFPVTFHSSEGLPGTQWETTAEGRKIKKLIAIDRDSGKMIPLETETRYYPGEDFKKVTPSTPEKELEIANYSEWSNSLDQSFFNKERADEILRLNEPLIRNVLEGLQSGKYTLETLDPTQRAVWNSYQTANSYLQDVHKNINNLFSKAYKYGTPEQRNELMRISEKFKEDLKNKKNPALAESQAIQNLLVNLKRKDIAPQMYVPIEEFATEKSSQSFGNAAFEAYKKFGEKTPILSIENPPSGFAISTGEELKNLIEKSREQFVKRAVETGKLSESEARNQAKKLIGATWDVGHINMLRKSGASEKDIIKETEKIAPFVKHIHLSDNFGFEHTELPMGMGNVPLKEMMEKLPQKDIKKIIEAGTWWQHFQTNPMKEAFEGLGSPMYSTGTGPFWNQTLALQQGYFSGYGQMLPSINYETFGAGFSRLPMELGGNQQASGGRMSGTPME